MPTYEVIKTALVTVEDDEYTEHDLIHLAELEGFATSVERVSE